MPDPRQSPTRARLSPALLIALDHAADQEHAGNRSAAIKAMLAEGLTRRGLWPPRADEGTADVEKSVA